MPEETPPNSAGTPDDATPPPSPTDAADSDTIEDRARDEAVDDDVFEPFDPEAPLMVRGTDAVIRGIDWRGAFPFTRLFRAARLAAAPSKVFLALVGILLLYIGGQSLDGLWYVLPVERAVPQEIELFEQWQATGTGDFDVIVRRQRDAIERNYNALADRVEDAGDEVSLGEIKEDLLNRRDASVAAANRRYREERQALRGDGVDASLRATRSAAIEAAWSASVRDAYVGAVREWEQAQAIRGVGPFGAYLDYEVTQLNNAVWAVLMLNPVEAGDALYGALVTGPTWGMTRHFWFFLLFFPLVLVIMSVCGGAICRIAAVEFAKDEKITIRDALRFSSGKFLSFLSAPLIPVLMLLAIGLLVAAGGALANIPVAGPIIVGAGFFLALLGGLVMALVVVGLVGGFNLMYPTIAAEGSDSFDAISRSFSYLYAKPWRLLFYSAVALLFGALAYTAAHLFTWLILKLAHGFAGLFVFRDIAGDEDTLHAIWTDSVAFGKLSYDINFLSLNAGQDLAAFFLAFWVYLVIGLLGAFAASLYFCSGTIIYFLMRREVDATEFHEVYLERDHLPDEPEPAV